MVFASTPAASPRVAWVWLDRAVLGRAEGIFEGAGLHPAGFRMDHEHEHVAGRHLLGQDRGHVGGFTGPERRVAHDRARLHLGIGAVHDQPAVLGCGDRGRGDHAVGDALVFGDHGGGHHVIVGEERRGEDRGGGGDFESVEHGSSFHVRLCRPRRACLPFTSDDRRERFQTRADFLRCFHKSLTKNKKTPPQGRGPSRVPCLTTGTGGN